MTTANQRRTRRLVTLAAARKRAEAGLAIAKRATEKWAFKVLQKAMPELHKLMRYDESTQFTEDPRLGTITAYMPSREKDRDVEWEHVWGLHHDEDGYYVSVRQGPKENVLDIDISEMNPKGVSRKLYEAGGHKIRMGTFAKTRVKAAMFKNKALEKKLDSLADGADSFEVMRDDKLAFFFPDKSDAQTFEKKAAKVPGATSSKLWPTRDGDGMFIVYVQASTKVKAAPNPKVVRDLQQMGILPETESPADYPEIGQDPTWESLEVSASVKKDIIATLITQGKTELANQAAKLLTVRGATDFNQAAQVLTVPQRRSLRRVAGAAKIEKTLTKLPGKEYKDIFTNGTFSNWEGKLADVFWPFLTEYSASDFIPETLTRVYTVYFVDDGKGKPLKVDPYWEKLVGQNFNSAGGNKFFGSRTDFGAGGRGFTGEFLGKPTLYGLKIKLKDMSGGEIREYASYLEGLGYIDASEAKVSAAMWKKFLTAKTWDELYEMDPKTESANAAYKLIDWIFKDDSDAVLKKVKGVYALTKKGEFKFVVPPPKAGAKASVTAASNPEVVRELKQMGILPETENPADYPPIGPDDTWESLHEVPAGTRKDVIATLLRAGKPELANVAAKSLVTAIKLSPRDQNVILSFIDQQAQEGKKLSTDGKRLDGNWMGGRGIAEWEGGKIHLNDLGSKAAQTVHRMIRKMAAPNDIAASTVAAKKLKKGDTVKFKASFIKSTQLPYDLAKRTGVIKEIKTGSGYPKGGYAKVLWEGESEPKGVLMQHLMPAKAPDYSGM